MKKNTVTTLIKMIISFKGRTFTQIVQAIAALQVRYKGLIVSYRSKAIGAGLYCGRIQITYP